MDLSGGCAGTGICKLNALPRSDAFHAAGPRAGADVRRGRITQAQVTDSSVDIAPLIPLPLEGALWPVTTSVSGA